MGKGKKSQDGKRPPASATATATASSGVSASDKPSTSSNGGGGGGGGGAPYWLAALAPLLAAYGLGLGASLGLGLGGGGGATGAVVETGAEVSVGADAAGGAAGTEGADAVGGGGRRRAEAAREAPAETEWTVGYYASRIVGRADGEAHPSTRAILFPNGGGGSGEPVAFESEADFIELGRLYNDLGQIVPSRWHFENDTALYRGPEKPGTHFQWPSLGVGTRRTVPGLLGGDGGPVELETLTDPGPDGRDPRVFYVHNFLSREETDSFISWSTDDDNPYKMATSTAGSHKSWSEEGGRDHVSTTRTSMNAFDTQTEVAMRVKKRGFRLLRMGRYYEPMADGIQILRYELGQAYVAHHDYFPAGQSGDHGWHPSKGGSNRFATIFLYLSDVEYGGQTVFPESERLTNDTSPDLVRRLGDAPSPEVISQLLDDANLRKNSWEAKLIRQCYSKFAVPPRRGDAILFYSQKPDGRLDPTSIHGACPVLKGTKWGANLWVWNACRYSMCKKDALRPAEELPQELKAPFRA